MGRPTKRNPETEATILDALANGSTRKDSAESAGVAYRTFLDWVDQFPQFSQAVTRAEAECANRMARCITDEATRSGGDWRAALEWLKRRRKEDWSERQEVTGPNGGDVTIKVLRGVSMDDL